MSCLVSIVKNVRYCVDSYIVTVINSCGEQEFTCSNQQCVSVTKICDLQSDCQDGSDEDVKNCGMCSSYLYYKRLVLPQS